MDRIGACGASDAGSIPAEGTKRKDPLAIGGSFLSPISVSGSTYYSSNAI